MRQNEKEGGKTMVNINVLRENVKHLLFTKGWTQERLTMHMGWGSSATYARKFSKNAKWSFDEINRLLKWAGKSFEEIFIKPLLN